MKFPQDFNTSNGKIQDINMMFFCLFVSSLLDVVSPFLLHPSRPYCPVSFQSCKMGG